MNCELCGKKVDKPKKVVIEGSTLNVCEECSRYGKKVFSSEGGEGSSKDEILARIERRRNRKKSYELEGGGRELALDYSNRIRDARLDNDWTQEDLADEVSEKRSVIAKLEKGDLHPNDDLIGKLENTLDIELMEEYQDFTPGKTNNDTGMTLGDFIKEE